MKEGFPPGVESRLKAFRHILERTMEVEESIGERGSHTFGVVNDKGKVVEPFMTLDQRFVHRWYNVAENIYRTEFAKRPRLKYEAESIRDEVRAQFGKSETMSPGDLNHIYELDDDIDEGR